MGFLVNEMNSPRRDVGELCIDVWWIVLGLVTQVSRFRFCGFYKPQLLSKLVDFPEGLLFWSYIVQWYA